MSTNQFIPIPYFKITKNFDVLEVSAECDRIFPKVENFLELVDIASRKKTEHFLSEARISTEINVKTIKAPIALYKIELNWEGDIGHLVCIELENQFALLLQEMENHRKRLAKTDMELLIHKEELEKSLLRITELSGPVINITNDTVLVPLFGELTEELIENNRLRITEYIHKQAIEEVIIDFQAIGKLQKSGVISLKDMVDDLTLLGAKSYITGITPLHAQTITEIGISTNTTFKRTLRQAIDHIHYN
ncbi:STAS domain-containing protein [Bacillus alkalicellulosilyticus]|uniref:STAS domain-containing protein n=1 Tax=Alkalihalobacterium alkalicellulosilyticum TaxID=1912214 RepID=UPI0009962E99|nr:STAS domain-containing protein [Bacillus alkalicellulosilyticus]